ncbi:hypothetical protein BC936DRAFT_143326 [Jimgerdemannia flammicorona]|uniref:Uncharacterized protein n=1 Tax=Jimgerdemannia flammicorona TaxID=994334 RepID=A0A433DE45_9FUNG|nr:hypothetical protein BC936DRAFT_143326 [Jimgerdemannia flammicorona]
MRSPGRISVEVQLSNQLRQVNAIDPLFPLFVKTPLPKRPVLRQRVTSTDGSPPLISTDESPLLISTDGSPPLIHRRVTSIDELTSADTSPPSRASKVVSPLIEKGSRTLPICNLSHIVKCSSAAPALSLYQSLKETSIYHLTGTLRRSSSSLGLCRRVTSLD